MYPSPNWPVALAIEGIGWQACFTYHHLVPTVLGRDLFRCLCWKPLMLVLCLCKTVLFKWHLAHYNTYSGCKWHNTGKYIYIYGSAFLQKNCFVNGSVVTSWNAYICHWHTNTALNPFWTKVIESNLGNQLVFIENMFILSPVHMCPKPCTSRLLHLVSQLVHAPLQLTWIATLLVGQKWSL